MLIYSKPLTADMQILWSWAPTLCSNTSRVRGGFVRPGLPIRRPVTEGTYNAHTSSSDAAPVLIVAVRAVAQLLPAGWWAEERLEGDIVSMLLPLPGSPAPPSVNTSTSLPRSETMGKLGTKDSS